MKENDKKLLQSMGGLFFCFILAIAIPLIEHPILLKYPDAILLLAWIAAKSILIPLGIGIVWVIVSVYLIYRKYKKSKRYKLDL